MASTGFVVRVVASHGTASSWMAISAGRHSEDQPILECRRVHRRCGQENNKRIIRNIPDIRS